MKVDILASGSIKWELFGKSSVRCCLKYHIQFSTCVCKNNEFKQEQIHRGPITVIRKMQCLQRNIKRGQFYFASKINAEKEDLTSEVCLEINIREREKLLKTEEGSNGYTLVMNITPTSPARRYFQSSYYKKPNFTFRLVLRKFRKKIKW